MLATDERGTGEPPVFVRRLTLPARPLSLRRMSHVEEELADQPRCWRQASELAGTLEELFPRPGDLAAVVGCGTSWFVSSAYAALRRSAGLGRTEAFAASEFLDGPYDRVIAISRSGTTTEVLRVVRSLDRERITAITGPSGTPLEE